MYSKILSKGIILTFLMISYMPASANTNSLEQKFAVLEKSYHGRIGIFALNTANDQRIEYRADERFPFCSTSKLMAVAAILKKSMSDSSFLQKTIFYNSEDLVEYSPITENHVQDGMTISAISEAAMTVSDNTAMNLLIGELGGTTKITQFARSIGDNQFRLDRVEPELNTSIPGDTRDTTTPAAMGKSLQKLTLGNSLGITQQDQLLLWLKNNTTGNNRIRAGVPNHWVVGDKTGGGSYGVTNDIGILYPPHCKPIIIVIYFTQNIKDAPKREEVVAEATRMVIAELSQYDTCLKNYSIKKNLKIIKV